MICLLSLWSNLSSTYRHGYILFQFPYEAGDVVACYIIKSHSQGMFYSKW